MNRIEIQQFALWNKLSMQQVPLSFGVEVTARCNLNCRHCYINLPARDLAAQERELPLTKILDIARQAVDLGSLWCLLSGGEPLLRKDFIELYLGLKRLGLLVSVFTNGTLVSREHVELFKDYPPRDLEITVYGVTQATFERVTRQSGSFKNFLRGLDLLQAGGVPFRLKAMAMQSNVHEQRQIADFCRSRTKDYYRFDPSLHLRYDGNPERNAEICSERLTADQIISIEGDDKQRVEALRKICDGDAREKSQHHDNTLIFNCLAGVGSFNVSYDGVYRLCSSLCAAGTTFDLKTGTLSEAYNIFTPKIRSIKSNRPEYVQTCSRCSLKNVCFWCPAHSHLETGKLDEKISQYCEIARKRAESVGANGLLFSE